MNRIEISKELLEEVLNYEVDAFLGINENEIDYTCCRDENIGYEDTSINLYEFAFKCKEWAINKGYQIISGLSDEPAYRPQDERAYSKLLWYEGDDIHREYKDMYFMANTEVEAVIKASEYVLNNLDFEESQKEAFECLNDLDKFNKLQDA